MKKSNVQYSYPLEKVSRKLTLRKNTASDKLRLAIKGEDPITLEKDIARYMGTMKRTYLIKGVGAVERDYLFIRFNKRSTALSAEERAAQTLFGNCAKLRAHWKYSVEDAVKASQAWQDNRTIQGVSPYGKTFTQWTFLVAAAVLDAGGTITSPFPNA